MYKSRKFDIRIWVVATSSNELFFYNKGYIRTSSTLYSTESTDPKIHLTNNCYQQKTSKYSLYEPGNTIPLDSLFDEIKRAHPTCRQEEVRSHVMRRMKDIVIDTFLAFKE